MKDEDERRTKAEEVEAKKQREVIQKEQQKKFHKQFGKNEDISVADMKIAFDYHGKVFSTETAKPVSLTTIVNTRVSEKFYDVQKSEVF